MRRGAHNLRHSFGRRPKGTGVLCETRKALLCHANGDITTCCSAAELSHLTKAAETIVDRGKTKSTGLTYSSPRRVRRATGSRAGRVTAVGGARQGADSVVYNCRTSSAVIASSKNLSSSMPPLYGVSQWFTAIQNCGFATPVKTSGKPRPLNISTPSM